MRKAHTIGVKHNIEVAHRLFLLPGKCENIHGHSMWVTLELEGELNQGGVLNGIEFGDLKKTFRGMLDREYDHRVLLNVADPLAGDVVTIHRDTRGRFTEADEEITLPGVNVCPADPTTEHIAYWIHQAMKDEFTGLSLMPAIKSMEVTVWETPVNMATYYEDYEA